MIRFGKVLLAMGLLASTGAGADFLNSKISLHPSVPQYRPFVLELSGIWEGSCHPGIAVPVIKSVDGLKIDIELVLDPIPPCLPDVETPYRVLVDMSEAFDVNDIDPLPASDLLLDVTITFLGETLHDDTLLLGCFGPNACPASFFDDQTWPEPGLYQGQGLLKQGLLLARQNDRMAAYPLTYDENGSAEWLFAGGGVSGDTYFAPLYQASGGQCLGCPPPDDPPVLEPVGNITMLFDSEGVAQVKIDDGPFTEYRALDFGYGAISDTTLPDLSGRWALVETGFELQFNLSTPPALLLPLVFDFVLDRVDVQPPLATPQVPPVAVYAVNDANGEAVTEMQCTWTEALVCEIDNPEFEDGSHSFLVDILSPERIRLTDTGPMLAIGVPATGIAVRID